MRFVSGHHEEGKERLMLFSASEECAVCKRHEATVLKFDIACRIIHVS
jgi:hypothetical protein